MFCHLRLGIIAIGFAEACLVGMRWVSSNFLRANHNCEHQQTNDAKNHIFISTEGALRLPTIYDNHPIQSIKPIHI